MAPPSLAKSTSRHAGPEEVNGQYSEPLSGVIISVILAMLSLVIISIFLSESHPSLLLVLFFWLTVSVGTQLKGSWQSRSGADCRLYNGVSCSTRKKRREITGWLMWEAGGNSRLCYLCRFVLVRLCNCDPPVWSWR